MPEKLNEEENVYFQGGLSLEYFNLIRWTHRAESQLLFHFTETMPNL